jgi:hypothetical protein
MPASQAACKEIEGMKTTYITNAILRALRSEIAPTISDLEARVAEQGYICCHALTVRAGAAKAEQFAADLAKYVLQHNHLAAMRAKHAPGSEYYRYMTERMDDIRCMLFAWANGDPEIVTACGHNTVPVAQAIDNLLTSTRAAYGLRIIGA